MQLLSLVHWPVGQRDDVEEMRPRIERDEEGEKDERMLKHESGSTALAVKGVLGLAFEGPNEVLTAW
jgi:hypothetical protein